MTEREVTAQNLIDAGIALFGEHGFKATTTRMIADQAGANIGSIAYYFGNKEGLYLAIAKAINERLTEKLSLDQLPDPGALPKDQVRERLIQTLNRMVDLFVADQEAEQWMMFIQREQIAPSPAFDHLYNNAFSTLHCFLTSLIARLRKLPAEHTHAILQAHLLVGQMSFLLTGKNALLRRLGSKKRQLEQTAIREVKNIIATHVANLER